MPFTPKHKFAEMTIKQVQEAVNFAADREHPELISIKQHNKYLTDKYNYLPIDLAIVDYNYQQLTKYGTICPCCRTKNTEVFFNRNNEKVQCVKCHLNKKKDKNEIRN